MSNKNYEKPENVRRRAKAYRERMQDKGWKHLSVWVPQQIENKIKGMIEQFKESEKR